MSKKLSPLAQRIKKYEHAYSFELPIRTPVLIRLDGKAFSTFTKGFKQPFSVLFKYCMIEAAKELCKNIQTTQIAYTQSDEITLLLVERGENTEPWFSKNIQKMVSVSSSICTSAFNKALYISLLSGVFENPFTNEMCQISEEYADALADKPFKAFFDSRAFCVPEFEVNNVFIFRQRDAIRNSMQALACNNFSNKDLQNKNTRTMKEMLANEKGIIYDDLPAYFQHGVCIVKETYHPDDNKDVTRTRWVADVEIPLCEKDKSYINRYLIYDGDLTRTKWKE